MPILLCTCAINQWICIIDLESTTGNWEWIRIKIQIVIRIIHAALNWMSVYLSKYFSLNGHETFKTHMIKLYGILYGREWLDGKLRIRIKKNFIWNLLNFFNLYELINILLHLISIITKDQLLKYILLTKTKLWMEKIKRSKQKSAPKKKLWFSDFFQDELL